MIGIESLTNTPRGNRANDMIRIAYAIGEYPEQEFKRRADVALSYASAEVEIGILRVPAAPFGGLGPAEIEAVAPLFHQTFIQAEEQGYDAVVPLGMLDLGVQGGRSLVDIPVIGPLEASLHVAALLGDRFGLIAYHPTAIPRHRQHIRALGMDQWVVGHRAVNLHLRDITAHHHQMVEAFLSAARSLIEDDGAEVIIPHGITQCPVHIKPDWLTRELGVPVVEGIGAPIRMAALLVSLGLKHSRIRWPRSPRRQPS
jgi:allantoin racemase